MPSHSGRGCPRSGFLAPGVEPLEDRILLSGTATAAGATHIYSYPSSGQWAAYYAPGATLPSGAGGSVTGHPSRLPAEIRAALDAFFARRPDLAPPTYSPLLYVTGLLASLPVREYYASHTGCPEEPPRASPHREEAPSRPPSETPVAAPAAPAAPEQALVAAAVSLLVAARAAAGSEPPTPEVTDEDQGGGPPPTEPPAGQPAQEEDEKVPTAPLVALEAPALDLGDWSEAARQFLRSLETLGGDAASPEAFWVRLGLWGLAAATTVVMFELFREHLIKRRIEALDLAMPRRFREYDFTPR